MRLDHASHRVDDVEEADPAAMEGLDTHLVGGVVDRRGSAPGLPHLPRQPDGGEGVVVERMELPGLCARPVAGLVDVVEAGLDVVIRSGELARWVERGVLEFTLARALRDPDAEIVVYCKKGNRSGLCVRALKRIGYRNVKAHVGFDTWVQAGLPFYNFLGEARMTEETSTATC